MDKLSIPSTAIYAGGLAHTFEYHTTGVHATPHLHWSFPLKEGATITCPILVAEGVVYVGDSAGFLSAIDAHSGNLLWRFATDWTQGRGEPVGADAFTGVTAFCLTGKLAYVATSAEPMLYEVDLSNGQALRSWDEDALEGDVAGNLIDEEIFLLFFYDRLVWINHGSYGEYSSTTCLDPATGSILPEISPDTEGLASEDGAPVIYSHPQGNFDVAYVANILDSNAHNCAFYAINLSLVSPLSPLHERAEGNVTSPILWSMGEDGEEFGAGFFTILDEALYAASIHIDDDDDDITASLLALDPLTGAVHWRYTIPEDESKGFQMAAASHLIFLVTDKAVEAVDTHTHQRRWKWTSHSDERHALVADGLLFVLDDTGQVTALDIHAGEQRWHWQAEQPITGQLSTIADATLYLAMGHTLCALR